MRERERERGRDRERYEREREIEALNNLFLCVSTSRTQTGLMFKWFLKTFLNTGLERSLNVNVEELFKFEQFFIKINCKF